MLNLLIVYPLPSDTSSKGSGETVCMRMDGSRGGTGGLDPLLKDHNTIGFPSSTGPDSQIK